MPIAAAFRDDYHQNYFRDALIYGLQACGGKDSAAYLASGYLTNFAKRQEAEAPSHNIIDAIGDTKLFTFGAFDPGDIGEYRSLRDSLLEAGVDVQAKYLPEEQWHAKVFLLWKGAEPVFGSVGSSNFSGRAMSGPDPYGIWGEPDPFGIECDTFFWLKRDRALDDAMNAVFHHQAGHPRACLLRSSDDEVEDFLAAITDKLLAFDWKPLP